MKMRHAIAQYESFQKLITYPCIEEADIKNYLQIQLSGVNLLEHDVLLYEVLANCIALDG
jgi:hypothetical protein